VDGLVGGHAAYIATFMPINAQLDSRQRLNRTHWPYAAFCLGLWWS
jgi:hypothetical protein